MWVMIWPWPPQGDISGSATVSRHLKKKKKKEMLLCFLSVLFHELFRLIRSQRTSHARAKLAFPDHQLWVSKQEETEGERREYIHVWFSMSQRAILSVTVEGETFEESTKGHFQTNASCFCSSFLYQQRRGKKMKGVRLSKAKSGNHT